MKHDDARGSTQSYELPAGTHLLIDPAYAGEADKVQAGATKTWCTGGDGGIECLVWAARAEGAQTQGGEDGRMWADMIIGVDTATIVLVDAEALGAISGNHRPQVGEYVEIEAPDGATLHVLDHGDGLVFGVRWLGGWALSPSGKWRRPPLVGPVTLERCRRDHRHAASRRIPHEPRPRSSLRTVSVPKATELYLGRIRACLRW